MVFTTTSTNLAPDKMQLESNLSRVDANGFRLP